VYHSVGLGSVFFFKPSVITWQLYADFLSQGVREMWCGHILLFRQRQDMQCKYNLPLRHICAMIVAVEKQ